MGSNRVFPITEKPESPEESQLEMGTDIVSVVSIVDDNLRTKSM